MNRAPASLEPARVLVVDDVEANRDLLVRRLQRQAHATETAENGRVALSKLLSQEFDLVLLDIMMPEMNGYELLQHMRSDATLKHVPVILISALDDTDSVVKGIELGADDHLPKPFNQHILRARVESSLARKRLRDREQLYAASLRREMDIARNIQACFLPHVLPQVDGWDFAAGFQPAREVGGDFYDAFPVQDGRYLVLVVADVCDKGVGAALFMALFRSLLRAQAEQLFSQPGDPQIQVCQLADSVNSYIARTHERDNMFATAFVSVLDPSTGALIFVNAGHEAPLLCDAKGVKMRLGPTGPALGITSDGTFNASRISISAGETLLAFTDGVSDVNGEAGGGYSEAQMVDRLQQGGLDAATGLSHIVSDLQSVIGSGPQFDDITLLVLRRCV